MRGCSRDFAASKRVPLGHSSQQALVTIKQAADAFKAKGNARITATGHTDTSGPQSSNASGVRRGSGQGDRHRPPFFFRARTHDSTCRKAALALIWLPADRVRVSFLLIFLPQLVPARGRWFVVCLLRGS